MSTYGLERSLLPRAADIRQPAPDAGTPKARGKPADRVLVGRLRAGDRVAFERIFRRYESPLLSYCRHMLGNRTEAEDAVQQTFIRAHRGLASDSPPRELGPWLYAIARNCCRSAIAARHPSARLDDHDVSVAGLAAEVAGREDLRELVGDLQALPEDQRSALLLAELGDLSHEQIARVVDCPPAKVKALVHQARTTLIAQRQARAAPCEEIRMELSVATGGVLRRGPLRRHLGLCPGCREFADAVRAQRSSLAVVLPVLPTAGLAARILGATAAGHTAGAIVTAAGSATATAAGGVTAAATTGAAGGVTAAASTGVTGGVTAAATTAATGGITAAATTAATGAGSLGATVAGGLAAKLAIGGAVAVIASAGAVATLHRHANSPARHRPVAAATAGPAAKAARSRHALVAAARAGRAGSALIPPTLVRRVAGGTPTGLAAGLKTHGITVGRLTPRQRRARALATTRSPTRRLATTRSPTRRLATTRSPTRRLATSRSPTRRLATSRSPTRPLTTVGLTAGRPGTKLTRPITTKPTTPAAGAPTKLAAVKHKATSPTGSPRVTAKRGPARLGRPTTSTKRSAGRLATSTRSTRLPGAVRAHRAQAGASRLGQSAAGAPNPGTPPA